MKLDVWRLMKIPRRMYKIIKARILGLPRPMQIALLVILLLAVGILAPFLNAIYGGGWEVNASISAVYVDGRWIKSGTTGLAEPPLYGAAQWHIDPDKYATKIYDPYPYDVFPGTKVDTSVYGMPDIIISRSDPKHTDFSGKEIPPDKPVDTVTVKVNDSYELVYDYHIYTFTVTIKTDADGKVIWSGVFSGYAGEFKTAWGFKAFDGTIYVTFSVNPWKIREGATNGWTGIMGAYVIDLDTGLVTGTATPTTGAQATPGYSKGSAINMYTDVGGDELKQISWNNAKSVDDKIPSTVALAFPVHLEPGAHLVTDTATRVTSFDPANVFVKYTVRVDILTVSGFTLASGSHLPTEENPQESIFQGLSFWEGVADFFNSPGGIMLMMAIIVVSIVVLYIARKISLPV